MIKKETIGNELLQTASKELLDRGNVHDNSKLYSPEKEEFDRLTPILKQLTFGSEEYNNSLKELNKTLEHHYYVNSHHPQHYKNGINGMNLFDIIEMFMDWKAASERTNNGDIRVSIQYNQKRFEISEQLSQVFQNTANYLKWEK